MSDVTELTLTEQCAGLRKGDFSSVELTEAYLGRIERLKHLNAFITVCADSARASAKEADALLAKNAPGELLGVPVSIKDIILTKKVRTTAASKILSNFIPPYDATVTERLNRAGAVMLGKTNLDEFAMGSSNENSAFGKVLNPWNTAHVPGGSSGGSAVAVAARLSAASLGTDTGGSIRQPASYCSIVGIKPTYGRVSRYGVIAFASSLDQVGPFALSVGDCATMCSVLFGKDQNDSTSVDLPVPDFAAAMKKGVKGLRIGVPKEYFIKGMQPEVDQAVRTAISTLEGMGAKVSEISLPHTEASLAVYYILAPAEASSNLARYDGIRYGHRATGAKDLYELYCRSRAEGFGHEVKCRIMVGTYVLSTGYYDAFYLKAQRVRALIARDFARAFENECDLILSPAAPSTAFALGAKADNPIEMYLNDVFTIPVNLAGLPSMVLPCGFDGKNLPIGLQIIGKPWDEATMFQLAAAYEGATEWHKKRAAL